MYSIVYQFDPKRGKEEQFFECWEEMTGLIKKELGGLGSRLHKTEDGKYFAYAQWPDKDHWEHMRLREETGRMAELSVTMKGITNPSKVIFSGSVISNLFEGENS